VISPRCSDVSEAAGEPIFATATTAENWLLVEVRGTWPRDVSDFGCLDVGSRDAVTDWLERTPSSRLLFIRRPGRRRASRSAFVVRASERDGTVRQLELDEQRGLAGVDLERDGNDVSSRLVLVCAHGTRDTCCALRGSAVFGELRERLPSDDLWLSSHQGGHRFAANVLVLPAGVQLGRVSLDDARGVVADALDGRIALDRYRGRTAYTAREQAAEHAVRESRRLVRTDDLILVGDDGTYVTFRDRDGHELRAIPHEVAGPAVSASCGTEPEPQRHYLAQIENPLARIPDRGNR
jgi:hypothetical protein